MKTAKEIEAFVEAYGQCMGYESKENVQTIALMLSMGYDEERISERFSESRTVTDSYILWGHAVAFAKKPVKTTIEMYRESQYIDWDSAQENGGIYSTVVRGAGEQTLSDVMAAIVVAVSMCDGGEEAAMRVIEGAQNV